MIATTADVIEMFPLCSRCGEPVERERVRLDPERPTRIAHAKCLERAA